jgi:hypothetical protein
MPDDPGPWIAILLLGVWHGVNPGMGWLFATALGMQEQRGSAVLRALLPLAAGHAIAIAAAVLLALTVGLVLPAAAVQWIVAATLVGLGIARLSSHRHPRYGGMRVNARQLTIWSLLMASAHGAGLMVLPFVLRIAPGHPVAATAAHARHGAHATGTAALAGTVPPDALAGLTATAVHTVGYLIVTAAIALVVYHKLGLRLLRQIWVNLDLVWGVALIATGIGTAAM